MADTPEGPLQVGEMEPHEIQKRKQNPEPGEEQPHALVYTRGIYSAGRQLVRKEPVRPGGHQVEHQPAVCPCSEEV